MPLIEWSGWRDLPTDNPNDFTLVESDLWIDEDKTNFQIDLKKDNKRGRASLIIPLYELEKVLEEAGFKLTKEE